MEQRKYRHEQTFVDTRIKSNHALDVFSVASETSLEDMRCMREFLKGLPELPKNGIDAVHLIRKYLIDAQFVYDDNTFLLQDILQNKSGNCLGLSLLIGGILLDHNIDVKFRMIHHPKDIIDKKEQMLFDRLQSGGELNYQHPKLPKKQADHPMYRFGSIDHPVLIVDGIQFETTALDELEDDPLYQPEYESFQDISYEQLSSAVLSDRARGIEIRDEISATEA